MERGMILLDGVRIVRNRVSWQPGVWASTNANISAHSMGYACSALCWMKRMMAPLDMKMTSDAQ